MSEAALAPCVIVVSAVVVVPVIVPQLSHRCAPWRCAGSSEQVIPPVTVRWHKAVTLMIT